MNVLGIDPGKGGALSIVKNGALTLSEEFPLNAAKELDFIKIQQRLKTLSLSYDLILIEKIHAIFNTSAKSTFSFGRNYQLVIDAAILSKKPVDFVEPKTWQKKVLQGETVLKKNAKTKDNIIKKVDTKKMALAKATKLWPDFDFSSSGPRATKPHDGKVDSALIAYYGSVLRKGV